MSEAFFEPLFAANAWRLPAADRPARLWTTEEIVTTDFFAFDESDDRYELRGYDPAAGAVEMDDAVFGLVVEERMKAALPCPHWAAVRNVSDPEANLADYGGNREAAARAMAEIYQRHGYDTTINSAIVSWVLANS